MKKINELSNLELLELGTKGRQDIIDLECAIRGIKLLPSKPIKPVVTQPEKDATLYTVAGYNFTDIKEANKVLELLQNCTSKVAKNCKNYSGNNYYIAPLESYYDPKIESDKVYSAKTYIEIKNQLDKFEADMILYNEAKTEYDNAANDIKEIEDELNDKIEEVRNHNYNVEKYTSMYNRYLELANNENEIAKNFLLNSNPDAANYSEIVALWDGTL